MEGTSLPPVPSPELSLCWWQHHEEGEAIPALDRSSLTPFPGEDGARESKSRTSKTRHMLPNFYKLK